MLSTQYFSQFLLKKDRKLQPLKTQFENQQKERRMLVLAKYRKESSFVLVKYCSGNCYLSRYCEKGRRSLNTESRSLNTESGSLNTESGL